MSHVTHEWVMSRMNATCHNIVSFIGLFCKRDHIWVMSRMNATCHIVMRLLAASISTDVMVCHMCMSHVTYKWVTSHTNESCHTCKWVMSQHTHVRHIQRMNKQLTASISTNVMVCTCASVTSHIWMSHVAYPWLIHTWHGSFWWWKHEGQMWV